MEYRVGFRVSGVVDLFSCERTATPAVLEWVARGKNFLLFSLLIFGLSLSIFFIHIEAVSQSPSQVILAISPIFFPFSDDMM